jgi:ribosome-binding protein aMBF1 (putative translation factor)
MRRGRHGRIMTLGELLEQPGHAQASAVVCFDGHAGKLSAGDRKELADMVDLTMTPVARADLAGERLKRTREFAGLSVGQLAKLTGLQREVLDLAEQTLFALPDDQLDRIAKILHVQLLDRDGTKL